MENALTKISASELPRIGILATGGTIAGVAGDAAQMTGYTAGALSIQSMLEAVPQVQAIATVKGEQICNIDSKDVTSEIWLKLADRCNTLLQSSELQGLVITHGTDTMEETAYFLSLTVHSPKPVVLVGAMRPSTAISADGPLNLLNAVMVAASHQAIGRGVMVVMNENIFGARDVTKINTTSISAFSGSDFGKIGYLVGGEPCFYSMSVRRHTVNSEFYVDLNTRLPNVYVIYGHADGGGAELIAATAKAGARGIIYAGTGNGSIHKYDEEALYAAQHANIVIVRSSRVGNGRVVASEQTWTEHHIINGDTLNPQKARILLQLALTRTEDVQQIQRMFDEY